MIEPSLDLQKAIRARLVASSAVTSLVPASAIVDRNWRPEVFPCILIGEGQTLAPEGLSRNRYQVYADVHLWQTENGLTGVKMIAQAVRDALADGALTLDTHRVADLFVHGTRFMRDQDGLHSHGVMMLSATLVEMAA
jgi:hypothetical protein